jgi:competence protein ComEA
VIDAINLAGGALEDSNLTNLNLADKLSDGLKIYIPNINEEGSEYSFSETGESSNGFSNEKSKKVNINSATKEELMTLKGIGESKAEAIISYRKEKGAFKSIEDIKNISGIKEQAFDKIKDFICV